MILFPDQLREARAFLGSIQYTPALDAAAAAAASASRGRQWNSRMWECRKVKQGRWAMASSAWRQPTEP